MESTQTSSDRHAASALLGEILRYAQNDDKTGAAHLPSLRGSCLPSGHGFSRAKKRTLGPSSACAFFAQAFTTAEHDSPARTSSPDGRAPRRAACGELVMMDSSPFRWLEERGPACHLIAMIDDASSRVWGRFAEHDSSEENLRTLGGWLERYGRPLALYTDKNGLFVTSRPVQWQEQLHDTPPRTQFGRALASWISSGSRRTPHKPKGASSGYSRCCKTAW